MRKPTIPSRPRKRGRAHSNGSSARRTAIAANLAEMDQMKPKTRKAAFVLSLLKTWLRDDSGYDERTWPGLRRALDAERGRVGAPRLFDE